MDRAEDDTVEGGGTGDSPGGEQTIEEELVRSRSKSQISKY